MTKRRAWLTAGAVAAVLAVLLVILIAAHVAGLAHSEAEAAACAPEGQAGPAADTAQLTRQVQAALTTSGTVTGLSAPDKQLPHAKTIVATGAQLAVPARGQVVALATALQESALRNLPGGDRDSLGLFQQRPSQGWGTREQIKDPVYASKRFYTALTSLKDWQHMPVTVAAQKVQKSAFPHAYAKHEPLATALQQAIAPTLDTTTAGPPRTVTVIDANGVQCLTQATGTTGMTAPGGALPTGYQIPASTSPAARTAIQWALNQLGTPYQWGGSCTNPHGPNPRDRCDCSSLIQRAYGIAGISISRTTYTQIRDGYAVTAAALRPGDLVFTVGSASQPEHVAMSIGHGLIVHAPRPGRSVEVASLASHGVILLARRVTD